MPEVRACRRGHPGRSLRAPECISCPATPTRLPSLNPEPLGPMPHRVPRSSPAPIAFVPLVLLILGWRSCSRASGATRSGAAFLRDPFFLHHIYSDLHHGDAGPLAGTALEDEKSALLNGELDVLHVSVVIFQLMRNGLELAVDVRELPPSDRWTQVFARPRLRLRPGRS